VLLVILAVLLVLLLLVLFVPIFYRVDASVPETDLEQKFDPQTISASAKFSWLWFVIRGGIEYPEEMAFTLRVFGIKILPKKEKAEKEDKPGNEGAKEEKTEDKSEEKPEEKTEDKTEVTASETSEEATADETSGQTESGEADESSDSESETVSQEEDEEQKSFLDVLWKIFDSIDNFLKTPLDVFEKIRCTISRVCDKIDMIKSTLENEIFQRAFELTKKKLIWVLKKSLPRKCDIKVLFGSGDPATTAEIMGAYGALYPVLYKKVEYTPDFERKVVKADVHIKGHLMLFVFIYAVAVCFFNSDVKKTIRRFKKIINS
jgi:hypothetical protein